MDGGGGEGAVLIADPREGRVRTVAETGSTNADMIALAANGLEEGVWLRAERQTVGRGRQGRAWVSPAGNLYASTLVRVRPSDPPAATLALVAAVALQEAVSAYLPGLAAIKWPNDLLIDGAKLSGILLERAGTAVAVGIGVNLAHHPDDTDRLATSLAAQGAAVGPADFIETLADAFARWVERWRGEGIDVVRRRWMERAHPSGTPLTARLPDGAVFDGLFEALDVEGALILRLADGTRRVIHAGDVFLL
ncbi:biotin--[acetyl-CoA-carboxylase] ligase [Sphingomonas sp.]|uniref:biotin--[acetyl-CoA-carboxylase] ligase n=1 Tax=Sphingomonas sp. TaxID=28214 RepID=UPI0025D1D238|nr:biotin--[acetyl-CoA-carboxylase] ligase [Sphingomonas sp.]